MTAPNGDPMVGRTVAQYQILARAGGGGMGVVYRARDAKLGRTVALKFLPQQWSHDEGAKQRFLREAQAASATNHPNICTIHDFETADDGQLFIVMAYYEGQTLKQRLEAGPIPIEEALDIATQVADGLAKAHAQGIVHRDIKPGNLMLTEDGVRILDFGLATFADALKLTVENSTLGTAAYMSPEQARGQSADARSDVWAVGVVLYEMLTGHVPFQGSHAEAIGYAIRNEAPTPLRSERPEASEDVERLVFRALHKEPSIRYQSGRELARALRQVRGLSLPLELRTEPVPVPTLKHLDSRWRKRPLLVAALVLVVGIASAFLWLMPVERTAIVVVPVVNQTGYPELDVYRLALTHTLILELADSPNLEVRAWSQMLERLRAVIAAGSDISSPEVVMSLTSDRAGGLILLPTLLNEGGLWRARVEIRDASTGTRIATLETNERESALERSAAYELTIDLADRIQKHFASWRSAYTHRPASARLSTLDAAKSYEEGVRAYDELEYSRARSMFEAVVKADPRSPMALAWLSRVLQLMGQTNDSRDAAERAVRLVTDQTPLMDSLFVAAVTAEARQDYAEAGEQYVDLSELFGGQPKWLIELGAWLDRRGENEQALVAYQGALVRDPTLVRPYLDLCRLNARLNEFVRAEEHGRRAQIEYSRLGDRALEAQALFCLTDVLRNGDDAKRQEARRVADKALQIFEALPSHPYGRARAFNYVALAAAANDQRGIADAAANWERALTESRSVANAVLEPLVLMNLGVTHESLGNLSRALEYHRESLAFYERLRDEPRAAENRANVGSMLIEYAGGPDDGLRYVENALKVFRARGNRNFEAYSLRVMGWHARNAGRIEEAEQKFYQARAIYGAASLTNKITGVTIDLALSRLDAGDYGGARDLLAPAGADQSDPYRVEALTRLASVLTRLGDFKTAASCLETARPDIELHRRGLLPILHLTWGELAVQEGRFKEARSHFATASDLWRDDVPDPASVEARANGALLAGLEGDRTRAERELRATLKQAMVMGRIALEARSRVLLARLLVSAGRAEDATGILAEMPAGDGRTVNPEIRAQAHYWLGRAFQIRGDRARAVTEADQAKGLVQELQRTLPESYRATFRARPDISPLLEGAVGSE